MIGGLIVTALVTVALPLTSHPVFMYSIIVLVIGTPAGLIMALPAEALPHAKRAPGMGIFYTCHYATMTMLPAVAGMVRDQSGSPNAPIFMVGMIMALAALALLYVRSLSTGYRN